MSARTGCRFEGETTLLRSLPYKSAIQKHTGVGDGNHVSTVDRQTDGGRWNPNHGIRIRERRGNNNNNNNNNKKLNDKESSSCQISHTASTRMGIPVANRLQKMDKCLAVKHGMEGIACLAL
jgi:hypothetical protein